MWTVALAIGGVIFGAVAKFFGRSKAVKDSDPLGRAVTAYERMADDWRDQCAALRSQCGVLERQLTMLDRNCQRLTAQCDALTAEGQRMQRAFAEAAEINAIARRADQDYILALASQLRAAGLEPAARAP